MQLYKDTFESLSKIPHLKEGWVRLVHRCIAKDSISGFQKNGLVFNREVAKEEHAIAERERGGYYDSVTQMATMHTEEDFWNTIKKDELAFCSCAPHYDDIKMVFDVPLEEVCFLRRFGGRIKGKVDAKYLVGCIPNVNGMNPKLTFPVEEVERAQKISQKSESLNVEPNDVNKMIMKLVIKIVKSRSKQDFEQTDVERLKEEITERLSIEKANVLSILGASARRKSEQHKTANADVAGKDKELQIITNLQREKACEQ